MFYNLLRGFCANGVRFTLLCSSTENFNPIFLQQLSDAGMPIIENNSRHKRFIGEQISCFSPRIVSDAVLFPNYFTPPFVPRRMGRVATVIHDFLHAERWNAMSRKRREWQRIAYRLTYSRAEVVIVPSDFVRERALELYGSVAHKKTRTIPNPISWKRFGDASRDAPFAGRPYVLTVAAQYPHKNLAVLIRAFAQLRPQFPDLLLVLSGQLPQNLLGIRDRTNQVRDLILELGLESAAITTGYLDDAELGNLYRHATLFAFPSLFEGFGMPAVEALGFGIPTVTTRRGSLPEVTMGAAFYLDDPKNVDEWIEKLTYMLRNPSAGRPEPKTIAKIRDRYSPTRIAGIYAMLCLTRPSLQIARLLLVGGVGDCLAAFFTKADRRNTCGSCGTPERT